MTKTLQEEALELINELSAMQFLDLMTIMNWLDDDAKKEVALAILAEKLRREGYTAESIKAGVEAVRAREQK